MIQKIPVSCNKDCGGGCPLLAHVENKKIIKITNNPAGTSYMQGCVRGHQSARTVYSPARLHGPLIRTGERGSGSFRKASWEEALDYSAGQIKQIIQKYGNHSVIHLGGSGSIRGALHNTYYLTARFLNLLGGYTEARGSYSSGAESFALATMFGTTYYGIDPSTLLFSKQIFLWGANPIDNIFGCEFPGYLREAKKRTIPIRVIDPRKTNTVKELACQWLPILPGTDTALMSALLYEIIKSEKADTAFLRTYTSGYEEIYNYIYGIEDNIPKTPGWAADICGIPAETIRGLACDYTTHKPTALIPGLSIQRTLGGEEAARMAVVLQAVTGNIGIPGGSSGGNIWGRLPNPKCGKMDPHHRPDNPWIHKYEWADHLLSDKDPVIHMIYNVGGNYLSQGSDIKKNIRAFKKMDFILTHDLFMTPTCRWSDVILPVSTCWEREDILFTLANYLLYTHKVVDSPEGVKDDYDIFLELAGRLGCAHSYSEGKTKAGWLNQFLEESEIQDTVSFKKTGIYLGKNQARIGLAGFFADPITAPLNTPSGKIEESSRRYADTGFPAIPKERHFTPGTKYPLYLISPHARYRINSQHSNIEWFCKKEPQKLIMNPADAASRNISDGSMVVVASPRGKVEVQIHLTEEIRPGVVSLNQGEWPEFRADGVETRGTANVLTSTEPTLPSHCSRTHSTGVEVFALKSQRRE